MLPLSLKKKLSQRGFTLVELLIVVVILGILATIVVTQFGGSTDDAKLGTLKTNLASIRSAVELYKQQHKDVYPGAKGNTDATVGTDTTAETVSAAFTAQLTQYTEDNGLTSLSKGTYGPYLKTTDLAIPKNPFTGGNAVKFDLTSTSIAEITSVSGTQDWLYFVKTGRFYANSSLIVAGKELYKY